MVCWFSQDSRFLDPSSVGVTRSYFFAALSPSLENLSNTNFRNILYLRSLLQMKDEISSWRNFRYLLYHTAYGTAILVPSQTTLFPNPISRVLPELQASQPTLILHLQNNFFTSFASASSKRRFVPSSLPYLPAYQSWHRSPAPAS